jgi:ComF family protein
VPAIFREIIDSIICFIYPPRCAFCDRPLDDGARHWCDVCDRSLRRVEADFTAPRLNHTWFDRARSALPYEGRVRDAVHGFKYGERFDLARVFAAFLYDEAVRMERPDVVMPVPLHPGRLHRRGFNQSAVIARPLAKRLGVDYEARGLVRARNTATQVEQKLAERLAAMKDAFRVRDTRAVKDRRVLLVDDVLTTGATINECARALKKAGAQRVDIVTIARVL